MTTDTRELQERLRGWRRKWATSSPLCASEPVIRDLDEAAAEIDRLRAENAELRARTEWKTIDSAPTDGTRVIVWAAPYDGLSGFMVTTTYHPDGGWCVDELRETTHWLPLPAPPAQETPDGE